MALALFGLVGCGDLGCPGGFTNTSGLCVPTEPDDEQPMPEPMPQPMPEPTAELCDGVDNDDDEQVDENWPELGEPCGEGLGVGECVAGSWECADDQLGVVCEGAVGPSDEVCDGKDNDCDGVKDNGSVEICDGEDNDCDGLIDEQVLAVKKEEVLGGLASVTAVEGGFAVARIFNEQLRLETYDVAGNRTGNHDDLAVDEPNGFLESDASQGHVTMAWGDEIYFAASAVVDTKLVPVIVDSRRLHAAWDQKLLVPSSIPPYHPRVSASSGRIVGYPEFPTLGLALFSDDLSSLEDPPTLADGLDTITPFEVSNAWVVREAGPNIRAAILLDDGSLLFDIDIGRGTAPSVAESSEALGVASVFEGAVQLTELNGLSLQCIPGRFCNEVLPTDDLAEPAAGPTNIDYHAVRDIWFVVAGRQIVAVGRSEGQPVVQQVENRSELVGSPNRAEVVVSDGTVLVMQSTGRESALTFLGCF